jgi:predicted Zn-dependent peptidase
MTESVQKTTLPNGVRVVTESIGHVQSISLGIWVATGARFESHERRGISHFLEHMLFKGTRKRPTAKQIADEMDAVGGYLNAFTDKEYTCYYARTLAEHLPLAVDILADMYTNSLFDPEETARERKVVLEEIKRRDDDPDDLVHDLFAQTIYPDHELGLPVIGRAEVVAGLTPEDLRTYMSQFYGPEAVIVAAAGNLEHEQVVALAQETLGGLKGSVARTELSRPKVKRDLLHYARPTEQVNFCIGTHGYGQMDDDKYTLAIIDTVLGGSMGSRLFQEIREKRGLAYSVGSYAATHREGGYFAAYGGTSPDTYEECLALVREEFAKVRKDGITDGEMQRAKNQFRGSIIMAQESMSSRMNRIGKSEVYFDRVIPLDEIVAAIEGVTQDDIRRVAGAVFPEDPEALTVAAVGPFDGAADAAEAAYGDAEEAAEEGGE